VYMQSSFGNYNAADFINLSGTSGNASLNHEA
jgi:hypothetical protein